MGIRKKLIKSSGTQEISNYLYFYFISLFKIIFI
jgi:hypothetical protein